MDHAPRSVCPRNENVARYLGGGRRRGTKADGKMGDNSEGRNKHEKELTTIWEWYTLCGGDFLRLRMVNFNGMEVRETLWRDWKE